MKRTATLIVMLSLMIGLHCTAFASDENATVNECMEMAKGAAAMILQDKDAALAEISKKDGKFVWKNSYVFAMDLTGKMLAHPMMPGLVKMNSMLGTPDKNVAKPKMIFSEFVMVAGAKGEGWVEYLWPKPDSSEPSTKETFIYRVPGTTMLVGAGIYR